MIEEDNNKFNDLLARRVQEIAAEQKESGLESWARATQALSPSSHYTSEALEKHNDNLPVRPESITSVTVKVRVNNERYETTLNIRGYLLNGLMQAYNQEHFSPEILNQVLKDFDPQGGNFFTTQAHEFILEHIINKLKK